MKQELLSRAIQDLEKYVRAGNWIGYDPYDLRAHPFILRMLSRPVTAFPTKAAIHLFPVTFRRLLDVKPLPHSKAMALFAQAYLNLLQFTGDDEYLERALERLQWLRDNAIPGHSGLAWGLPYVYQGRETIPSGVPSAVITSIAAVAFLKGFQVTKESRFLQEAQSAAEFLANDLPRYEPDGERLCFSKTTAASWNIHNSNLMTTATLVKVSRAAGHQNWDSMARKAVAYSLREQNPDGSWYYWGPPNRGMKWIDHYHTGFILRALDDILAATGWKEVGEPLERGYAYYTKSLFKEQVPCLTDRSCYPVDIHSCAEAILCLSQLAARYPDARQRAIQTADWTIQNMRHPSGYFYYRKYRWMTSKIPYMRWGQAWMLAALTSLQVVLDRQNSSPEERERI